MPDANVVDPVREAIVQAIENEIASMQPTADQIVKAHLWGLHRALDIVLNTGGSEDASQP